MRLSRQQLLILAALDQRGPVYCEDLGDVLPDPFRTLRGLAKRSLAEPTRAGWVITPLGADEVAEFRAVLDQAS